MRNSLLNAVAAASLLIAASPALAKGKWVRVVPVQNSQTGIFGINDSNIITGWWTDPSGITHGFVGPFDNDGTEYTSFDDPGGYTLPRGINDSGTITGFDGTTTDTWERSAKGKLTGVTIDGTQLTGTAQGINRTGVFAANYINTSSEDVGYLGKKSKYLEEINLPISNTGYAGRAIDTAGDVAGWYLDSKNVQHGFLIVGATPTIIDYPDASATVPEGMNDNGLLTGQWVDSRGKRHGFIYDIINKTFTDLDIPHAKNTYVWGINNNDVIAAFNGTESRSYVYCMTRTNCPSAGAAIGLHRTAKVSPANLEP